MEILKFLVFLILITSHESTGASSAGKESTLSSDVSSISTDATSTSTVTDTTTGLSSSTTSPLTYTDVKSTAQSTQTTISTTSSAATDTTSSSTAGTTTEASTTTATESTSTVAPTTSTLASTSTATANESCESFTESEDTAILPCLTGLYSLNIRGVLSIDQGCRYYNHVLKCISEKLNRTCGVTGLHKLVPNYLRSKPGIRQQFFQECTVSEHLTSDGFCIDSKAVLISGISVCFPKELPASCDYIGSVFLKCYNTYELDDYFKCSKGEMRQAFEDESNWFFENWNLNMSLCWNGDNIIVDICRTPMLQNNITMNYCRFLVIYFDRSNLMTDEDMCRQYTYYLKCIEGLFEMINTDGNYTCSLESLHKWVPRYFRAHNNMYNAFNASRCNVSEFDVSDYCSDRRAVFLTNVNLCQIGSSEIFECGYMKTLVGSCDQVWKYDDRPTNMRCTIRQRELAMESEAEYFQSKLLINVTNCIQDGTRYGHELCNKNISERDIIYRQFYACFKDMGYYGYFNRSGLLPLDEGCRIYNYAMHCVKDRLKTYTDYNDCDMNSISKWFKGEYYSKSTMGILVPKCNVTTHLNGSFCEDSKAVFFGLVGFCDESYRLNTSSGSGKKYVCSVVNSVLQSCYYYGQDVVYAFGCMFADRESAIIDNSMALNNKYGTNIDMNDCFQGCLSSSSCTTSSTTSYNAYASFNSTKCSCSYHCHSGYDNCCPDFYNGCVCTSDIWSYIDQNACKYLISNFNKTGTENEDDACRIYSYYLNCVQTQSMCPLEQLHDLVSDYIRRYHNDLYRFNTSRCNASMVSSLSDFCSDDRTLFQVGVNSECTKPRSNEIFTCGYLDNKVDNCYNWYWASSLITCNKNRQKRALLRNSDWFYKTWNINISICEEGSFAVCNATPSLERWNLYAIATTCFQELHIWFNRTGLVNSLDGCSYYKQILQCMNKGFGWNTIYKPCADRNLHDILTRHVIKSTKIYDIIQNCNVPTTIDKSFCEDEEAKLAYLLGVCKRTPAILHGRKLQNQSNICQILNSILVECHYEVRRPHFQCDFSQMYSPLDPNTGLLATRFDIEISECFSGCGTSYACCTEDTSSGYCSASVNGTECSCNDTCVGNNNCCPDFQAACHNITIVNTGGQPFENYSLPRTPGDFFRYGGDEGDSMIFGDDILSPTVSVSLGFPTVNRFFDHLKIGTNGIILFSVERNFNPPTPINFNEVGGIDFIAPFWTDINAPEGRSHVYYHVYDKNKMHYIGDNTWYFLKRVSDEIRHFYKLKYFNAVWVLITTWDKVLPPSYMSTSEEMTFQCILATDGMSSYAIFNYMSMNVTSVKGRQAAMGYRLSNSKMNDLSFNDAAFEIKAFPGNVGLNGYYIYKLTKDGGSWKNYKQLCYNWYDNHRGRPSSFGQISAERFNCPCTLSNIRFDWRWMKIRSPTKGVSCYALFATRLLPATRSCCYNDFYGSYIRNHPSAGAYHLHHPVFAPRSFATEESLPKEYCCLRSNLCTLYYELRPIGSCYGKLPFKYRWFYGDPHIQSLDGKQYTFNGIGEYVLMKIDNENVTFELQARTERILKENGTYSNATVFTAFAMKEENTTFQVELTDDRTRLVVFSNEYDYTNQYNKDPDFSVITEHIKLSRHNDTLVVVFGVSGLQLNITLGIRMLTFSTTVPEDFAGHTVGLVGNFDGDPTNDFILPNGTMLTENQTRTERHVFYNFGVHWTINTSNSVFQYHEGKSSDDYQDKKFVPIFIEDFDGNEVEKAKKMCGGKSSSAACVYDFLLTKDESIGKDSGRVNMEAIETVKTSGNEIPKISGDSAINAMIGLPTTIRVNASDDGNFTFHVFSPKTNFIFDKTESTYTWTPVDSNPINISITVIDNFGVAAIPLDVLVTMCGNCSNHGYCIYNETVSNSSFFKYAKCICEPGWTGTQCENDVNGCSGQPCSDGRECTDLTPVEEARLGRSFNCSSCPEGYSEKNDKCADIDECNNTNMCSQLCINSIGSFSCGCKMGFRLTEGYKCIDINECIEKNDCEQLCNNTEGSYNCSCIFGYTLETDNKSCRKENDDHQCMNNCTYACDENGDCICRKGFHLSADRKNCEDVDECTVGICQHNCNNTVGSFVCSCHTGYMLDDDGISCKECGLRKWGLGCANDCKCANGECDPVFGCKCDPGFSGADCDQDINECNITGICNDSYRTCINTHGSYICPCTDGYVEENEKCINIDECKDVTLNQCDGKTTTCKDTIGNYTCKCRQGYISDGLYKCKDFDECSAGYPCEQICLNNDGSYQCQCQNGFTITEDRSSCRKRYMLCAHLNCSYSCTLSKGNVSCFCPSWSVLGSDRKTCKDIDECRNNKTNKCSFKERCINIDGGYNCSCPDGFRLENDGRTCKECNGTGWGPNCKNECNCAPGAVTCNSTKGCICKEGYSGLRCENDIHECLEGPCNGQHEYCENIPGSFLCKCHQGYSKQSASSLCTNIDECKTGSKKCEHICTDFDGGYNCSCYPGFYLTDNGKCKDIDECYPGIYRCDQLCHNTIGCFRCLCEEGYVLNTTTRNSCDVKTECSSTNNCSQLCGVVNGGKEKCSCKQGYILNTDGITCENINECEQIPKICEQRCTDLTPGYQCSCNPGYHLDLNNRKSCKVQTTEATTLSSTDVTETISTEVKSIPEHESIKFHVNLTIEIKISDSELHNRFEYYKGEAAKMLQNMYSQLSKTFLINVTDLSVGSLHILYVVTAYKADSPIVSMVLYDAVNKRFLTFNNSTANVKGVQLGLTADDMILIKAGQSKRESLCMIYSTITKCSKDHCELDGETPQCRETFTDSSFTSGLAIGLISGIGLIMLIIIVVIIKFINYKKKVQKIHGGSQDKGMDDGKHMDMGKVYPNPYDSFPNAMDIAKRTTGEYRTGANPYYSISSGSSWREMMTDGYETLPPRNFKIQRPTVNK